MTAGDAERLVLAVASVQAQHDHVLIALPAVPTAGHSHAILDWDGKPYWRDAEAWKRIPALSVAWTCRARRAMGISDLTSRVAANLDRQRFLVCGKSLIEFIFLASCWLSAPCCCKYPVVALSRCPVHFCSLVTLLPCLHPLLDTKFWYCTLLWPLVLGSNARDPVLRLKVFLAHLLARPA